MLDLFATPDRKALRPYQQDALSRLRSSVGRGNRRAVLVLPTGAGKTLMASHIVAGALGKGGRAVFTAPMITLIDQTIDAFASEGITNVGAIQANHPRTNPWAPVQIASVQTLQRREGFPEAKVVLVDEAHVFSQAVVDWMAARPETVFIGLTATPGRKGMAAEWDDLVVGVTTRELIDLGFLSRFQVYAPNDPDLSGVKIVAGEYQAKGSADVMQDSELVGDILQNYLANGEGRPTLGFAVNVAHAKRMAAEFDAAGVPSAYVEARTDTLERRALQDQFRAGKLSVIWSVRTMTTGVDLPVSGIIDAAPTKSAMLHQQKVGRGLRVNPGTEDLVIWDHAGNTLRLGFLDELDWSELPDGERPEGGDRDAPLPKPCGECGALMAARVKVCPSCGSERKVPSGYVETREGDLVPLRAEPEKRVSVEVKQAWYAGLLRIAQERSYNPGWAFHKFKEKFGQNPGNGYPKQSKAPTPEMRAWVKSRQIAYAKAREKSHAA